MSLWTEAASRYRADGLSGLVRASTRYAYRRLRTDVPGRVRRRWRLRRGYRSIACGGTEVVVAIDDRRSDTELEYLIRNEASALADFVSEVSPGDTVYDVGANLGVYSVLAAAGGADVVAFEPSPPNVDRLRETVRRNGADADVDVRPIALSNERGPAAFMPESDLIGSVGIDPDPGEESITVRTRTADEFVATRPVARPDVVKLDVEGAEGLVLEGAGDAFRNSRAIYVEIHHGNAYGTSTTDFGYTPEEVRGLLRERGYRLETVVKDGNQEIQKAVRADVVDNEGPSSSS